MRPTTLPNGQEIYRPASTATWTAENLSRNTNLNADSTVGVVGLADGGTPLTTYIFADPIEAEKVLRRGPALEAVRYAFEGTNGLKASSVVVVNPNGGTRATFNVVDAADAVFGTATSVKYRESANQTSFSYAGSPSLGYTVVIDDPENPELKVTESNVGLGISLQYTGQGSAAEAEVVTEDGHKYLRTTITGATGDNLNVLLDGMTIRELVTRVQQSGPYSIAASRDASLDADQLDDTDVGVDIIQYPLVTTLSANAAQGATSLTVNAIPAALTSGTKLRYRSSGVWATVTLTANASLGATTLTVTALPAAIASGVKLHGNTANTAPKFSALVADFELFFETKAARLATWETVDGTKIPKTAGSGYFTGGSTVEPSISDWGLAVRECLRNPIGQLVPATPDQVIVAGAQEEVNALNAAGIKAQVQGISGYDDSRLPTSTAGFDDYADEIVNQTVATNNHQWQIVFQRGKTRNRRRQRNEELPLYLIAAKIAGIRAALGPNAVLDGAKVGITEVYPSFGTDILDETVNRLVRWGALVLEEGRPGEGASIVLDRTTYVGEDNPVYEDARSVAIMNSLSRRARNVGASILPGTATPQRITQYKRELKSMYEAAETQGWITRGIDPVTGEEIPAFEFEVGKTQNGGRDLGSTGFVNVTPSFRHINNKTTARQVEIVG